MEQKYFDLLELLEQKKFKQVKECLQEQNEADIAFLLEQIEDEQNLLKVFRLLAKDLAAEVFTYLSHDKQFEIIQAISEKELSSIMDELFLDDTIDIIESMPSNVVARILQNAKPDQREQINRFLGYKEDTAGSLMTPEYVELKARYTAGEALKRIRKIAQDKETINICYVLDNTRKLIGVVSIRDIILAEEETTIGEIMNQSVICAKTETPSKEVSSLFKKYDIHAIPVVDMEDRMVGIITVDDILDVIEETTTEEISKMAAVTPSEESYLKTSVLRHTRNRIIWLLLLMITAIFTGMLLTSYEGILAQEIVLVAFLPLLMDTAGNCGSQSTILMIRGMALGELSFKDYFKVFWKEGRISFLIGSALGAFNFVRIIIQYNRIDLAFAIALTVLSTVLVANIIGFTMPLIAKKLKLDPAVMSAPIITTILDCLVILIYFTISSAILGL